jgi:hypothetical protein
MGRSVASCADDPLDCAASMRDTPSFNSLDRCGRFDMLVIPVDEVAVSLLSLSG